MPHEKGYHKTEEARLRCWGCNHPEKLQFTTADQERAKQLIADGWLSTSSKHRQISRAHLPRVEAAIVFASGVPAWLRSQMRRAYEIEIRSALRMSREEIEHAELTVGEFQAFKHLGGGSA